MQTSEPVETRGPHYMTDIIRTARTIVRLADQANLSVNDHSKVKQSPTFSFVRSQSADLVNLFKAREKNPNTCSFENVASGFNVDPARRETEVVLGLVQSSLAEINRARRLIEWALRVLFGLFVLYLITMASVFV
jgi:hypothetical protein